MPRRAYRSEQRQAATAETRFRILEAARALLSQDAVLSFTVDSVAARASVSRMTIYNQFGSKPGLVEALADHLVNGAGIGRLPEAFQASDPMTGLETLIGVFAATWEAERMALRRLRALVVLDPELAYFNREGRRRHALEVLLRRLSTERGVPSPDRLKAVTDLLCALTSFDTYDTLATRGMDSAEAAGLIVFGARALLRDERPSNEGRPPNRAAG